MSWRPLGNAVHVGVRRSPLRDPERVVALARRVADQPALRFAGILGYEAQLAGLPDRSAGQAWKRTLVRAVKRGSRSAVASIRARVVAALESAGLAPAVVNGGGTGSVDWSSTDPALTEITIGSGFLCGHLFDGYRGLDLQPALAFALQIVRRPAPGVVTCLGGGWIASGQIGTDRLPRPAWPLGCRLLPLEGAGEVQTPVEVPEGIQLELGDPIVFRPAKSGELAEHVTEYLFVRGDRIVDRAPTYRGLGHCFL
jgi:D-serine deaminase-like pyridoxal phosphate-dependent protein